MSEEEVVARVFRGMGAPLHRLGEFSMARATVLSHLSYLHGLHLVAYEVQDGRVLWRLTAGPKG
jgi:hypothetical protein